MSDTIYMIGKSSCVMSQSEVGLVLVIAPVPRKSRSRGGIGVIIATLPGKNV